MRHITFLALAAVVPLTLSALALPSQPAFSPADYAEEVRFLEQVGPRLTGNDAHNELILRIEGRLEAMGLVPRSDEYSFEYLAPASTTGLYVTGEGIDIASVFPYSGLTSEDGIEGRLVKLRGPVPLWSLAASGIAVVPISNPKLPLSALVSTWDPRQRWGDTANPLVPAEIAGASLAAAKLAGVKAVVFAWDDSITDADAQGQYIPFTSGYFGIPAVFTSGRASRRLLALAGESAKLVVASTLRPATTTRTVYAIVEGTSKPDEAILVVTHTDGPNAVEENGHIGVLQLAQAALKQRPRRTHIFIFTTGHLRIPAFTKTGQATTRWLDDHPELWKGGPSQSRAVAGIVIEHLGAREVVEDLESNSYALSGRLEPELLYATTRQLRDLVHPLWNGTRISKPTSLIQFGEGAPLSAKSIPNVALVTAPLYLLAETNRSDLVDLPALQRQVASFEALRQRIDEFPAGSFGTVRAPGPLNYLLDGVSALLALGRTAANSVWERALSSEAGDALAEESRHDVG